MQKLLFWFLIANLFFSCGDNEKVSNEYKKAIRSKDLVAFWNFDDKTARDKSGNFNDGIPVGNYNYKYGLYGLAFHSTGNNDKGDIGGHVLIPMLPFQKYDSFTINLWIYEKSNSYLNGDEYWISFGDWNFGGIFIGAHFLHEHTKRKKKSRVYQYSVNHIYNDISKPYLFNDPFYTELNEEYLDHWIMHTLTYRNGNFKVYQNGNFIGDKNQTLNIVGNNAALLRHWWEFGNSTSTRFTGAIDEVMIWKTELDSNEIKSIYNSYQNI